MQQRLAKQLPQTTMRVRLQLDTLLGDGFHIEGPLVIQTDRAARQVSRTCHKHYPRSTRQRCALEYTWTNPHYNLRISGLRMNAPLNAMQHVHATELAVTRRHDVVHAHALLCCVVRAGSPGRASQLRRATQSFDSSATSLR